MMKIMREGVDGKLHPSEEKQDHYSICVEPGGNICAILQLIPKKGLEQQQNH